MDDWKKCVICDKLLANSVSVIVKEKAIQTLIRASEQRNDGKVSSFQNQTQIELHRKCRVSYTNTRCIEASKKIKNQTPESNEMFEYEKQCIFCGKDASDAFIQDQIRHSKEKRISVGRVQRIETKNTIYSACTRHEDDWSEQVRLRLERFQNEDILLKNGRYHYNCYKKFCHPHRATGEKRGRPQMPANVTAMDYVFRYLEDNNHDDCQFSVAEIREALHDIELPSDQLIKYYLKQKYGNEIVITSGNPSIICFLKNSLRAIQNSWYEARDKNEHLEKMRIVETAAKIVLDEILSRPYETDMYPPPNCFLDSVTEECPESLLLFLKTIVMNHKTNHKHLERKCVAIAHSIISVVRPRSFKSPLLLGVGAVIHHKYASRYLIDLLNSLGFCTTYTETLKFETSAIGSYAPKEVTSKFTQFVFDNADVNINTIDGKNTFHVMGGIQCINPPQTASLSHKIPRLNYVPKSFLKRFDQISMKTHEKPARSGLDDVAFKAPFSEENLLNLSKPHILMWLYGKSQRISGVPGWNTFMAKAQKEVVTNEQVTEIKPLPFINAPASNNDTILTALHFAAEQCSQTNTEYCVVTFDQPLFQKAQDIVKSSQDPLIKNIILRLGGFHLLMSFMGAIGYIMNGSGLKEMWSCVYAAGSLEKMMSGHHYERSVRAHSLSSIALFDIIVKNTDLTDAEKDNLLFQVMEYLDPVNDALFESSNELTTSAFDKINTTLEKLEERGPTAQLWVSYYKMTLIIQNYIKAERTGDWFLHLKMIKEMLPYFHAAGHFNYAKSASLYIHDMENLHEKMPPNILQKFVTEKLFTVRRTKKPYSGTWSDMTIEQSLMRSMKTAGGLTQGRGYTENVLGKWILGLPILHSITEEIEEFCDTTDRPHIHKDGTKSRIERDGKDIECLKKWLTENDPFHNTTDIMSISTGIVGNANINPHKAREIGINMMKLKEGTSYSNLKYSRKETVKSLATVNSAVAFNETIIPIEPDLIFKRISFLKKSQDELKGYLKYELSPYPVALFDKSGMRKTKKSTLYDMFKPVPFEEIIEGDKAHVIDGGFLLHKVVWPTGLTFDAICKKYINFIKNHYTNPTVVFDGYDNEMNVKNQERKRRTKGQLCAQVMLHDNTEVTLTQEKFLSNDKNKSRLIDLLKTKLTAEGIPNFQSDDDADTLIISTAMDISLSNNFDHVVVVGEDVDLLAILVSRNCPNLFMMKPGRGKVPTKLYRNESFIGDVQFILFLHAFTGCDTTSAVFKQGKKKACNMLMQKENLREIVDVFNCANSSPDDIAKSGEKFFCQLYGSETPDLNTLRYKKFAQLITKSQLELSMLPPTASAAKQHSFRVYYQIQKWMSNNLEPTDWGWKRDQSSLIPILTNDKPAPEEILKMISCRCKSSCKSTCTCIKAGLKCSAICIFCADKECNGESDISSNDLDEEIYVSMNISYDGPEEVDTNEKENIPPPSKEFSDNSTNLECSESQPKKRKLL